MVAADDTVRASGAYRPAMHSVGDVEARGQNAPGGQSVHCSSADKLVADEYVPAGHANAVALGVPGGQ